jgi:hypothetical protein
MSRARNYERTPPSSINHWVPRELDKVLAIALEEDPDARYASAGAMLKALEPILEAQGEGASTSAVAQWCKQLQIAEGVHEHMQTNHSVPLQDLLPKKKPAASVVMPNTQLSIPGVRRFVDAVHTVVDADFDPGERHRAVTESVHGEVAVGSTEFQASEQTEPMDDPDTEGDDFQEVGTTDNLKATGKTVSWSPKNER